MKTDPTPLELLLLSGAVLLVTASSVVRLLLVPLLSMVLVAHQKAEERHQIGRRWRIQSVERWNALDTHPT